VTAMKLVLNLIQENWVTHGQDDITTFTQATKRTTH